jgi:threonine synthase
VRKLAQSGFFKEPVTVTCVLTGHGLKDPDRAIKYAPAYSTLPADFNTVVKEIGLE